MKSPLLLFNLFIALTFFFSGCTNNITGEDGNSELPRELTTSEKKLVESGHSFSFNIFRSTVASENDDNIFISPLSISVALGMTLNGAGGETYNQMRETLAFHNLDLEIINSGYESLIELLKTADPKVKMEIANSVWAKKRFTVEQDFINQLVKYFDAEAQELDFDDPKSIEIINSWAS